MAIALACGPPSSFDHLTDGPRGDAGADGPSDAPLGDGPLDDPTLKPPQAVTPTSASWVNGKRPHFSWRLPPGMTSAEIQICPTRGCVSNVQTYEAVAELDPPDLAPGVWWWRVRSKTADSIGTWSPTWEVLVRGGTGNGRSGGSIFDFDGDGVPDLLIGIQFLQDAGPGADVSVLALPGKADGTFLLTDLNGTLLSGAGVTVTDPPVAVVDVNGDGFSDVVAADFGAGGIARVTSFAGGRPEGVLPDTGDAVNVPPRTALPTMREALDFDGDGFGDIVISTEKLLYTVFGTGRGLGAFDILFSADDLDPDAGSHFSGLPIAMGGGFDRNGDGLGDVAMSWPLGESTIFVFPGDPTRISYPGVFLDGPSRPTPPTAYTAGDMDGDGKLELAYVATFAGKSSVCVLQGTDTESSPPVCWSPATLPAGFASSLTAADLEADGKDEILVGSSSGGVDVLTLDAADGGAGIQASHIDTPFGARLTTITPGRPQPALWASTRADASAIQVWKGRAPVGPAMTVPPQFGGPVVFTPLLR